MYICCSGNCSLLSEWLITSISFWGTNCTWNRSFILPSFFFILLHSSSLFFTLLAFLSLHLSYPITRSGSSSASSTKKLKTIYWSTYIDHVGKNKRCSLRLRYSLLTVYPSFLLSIYPSFLLSILPSYYLSFLLSIYTCISIYIGLPWFTQETWAKQDHEMLFVSVQHMCVDDNYEKRTAWQVHSFFFLLFIFFCSCDKSEFFHCVIGSCLGCLTILGRSS